MTPFWLVHSQDELAKAVSLERKCLFPFRQSPPRYKQLPLHHARKHRFSHQHHLQASLVLSVLACFPATSHPSGHRDHWSHQQPPSLVLAANIQITEFPHQGRAANPVHAQTLVCQDVCVVKANQIVHLPSKGHHQVKNRWRMLATEGYLFFFFSFFYFFH